MIDSGDGFSLIPVEDLEVFDRYVQAHPAGHLYQGAAWGEVKMPGWIPWRFYLKGPTGEIRGAMTLLEKRSRLGPTFFYSPRGPVLDPLDHEAWEASRRGVGRFAKRRRALFWRMDPPLVGEGPFSSFPYTRRRERVGWTYGGTLPRTVWQVPLSPHPEEVLMAMRGNFRRICRRAESFGLRMEMGGRQDLPWFHARLHEEALKKGYAVRGLPFFERLWDVYDRRRQIRLFLVMAGTAPVGATLVSTFGGEAEGHFVVTTEQGKELFANHFLQKEILTTLASEGYALYDMGGIPVTFSGTERVGPLVFKSGFGGGPVRYLGEWDCVFKRGSYALFRRLEDAYYSSSEGKLWRLALSPLTHPPRQEGRA